MAKDHFPVFKTTLAKPPPVQKTVTFRKLRSINVGAFRQDIRDSPTLNRTNGTAEDLANGYSDTLKFLINKHAPLRRKNIVLRPQCPWYNEDLHEAKHVRRKLERKWRKSRLTIDHQIYIQRSVCQSQQDDQT